MSSLDNPFGRIRSPDHSERVEAIKLWTRQTLALTEEWSVSISEFGCSKPACPNKLTGILVMSGQAPTRKISIHKSVADICEADVLDAWRNSPS
jgi:hypothetical protein